MCAKPGTAESCPPTPSFAYAQLKVLESLSGLRPKLGTVLFQAVAPPWRSRPSTALPQLSVVKAPISNVKMSSDFIVLGSPTFQAPMCSTLGDRADEGISWPWSEEDLQTWLVP